MDSLIIKSLSKRYSNNVQAMHKISLEIGTGMFGLLGPNGAGKSTLMRTIATLQSPDSGTIHFKEIDVLSCPIELRKILGYLPQEFGVYPKETAEHLLHYFAILKGIGSKKERSHKIEEVLELTNLCDVRKKNVSDYSGGMRQRFGIAQLLLNNPKLIIVDEPTAGLDPAERKRFLNVLREVSAQSTVIFSTHIVDDVRELCNNMAVLNNGRILKSDTPRNATSSLSGKIWTLDIEPEKLEHFSAIHRVLSSSFNDDNMIKIRIYDEIRSSQDFVHAKPQLEDVYFYTLKYQELKEGV
ncbi:MAG: ABC transporter ATP-binding protein [Balneolaceae bacterium]